MKKLLTLAVLISCSVFSFAQLNMTYVGQITYDQALSDIWGYAAPDDTEYGIVGLFNGVSVVSLADPANPVESDFVPGVGSTWRDIKTWEEFAYVINESGDGLAVIDLSTLPDSVSAYNWAPNIPGFGNLSTCHNIYIDEFGYAYIAGCNLNGGGILILNVDTPTGEPEYVAAMPGIYSHDVYVRNNIAYSSEINVGVFSMYDVTDKQNIVTIGQQETPFSFTHNTWPSDDDNFLFTTDELANAPIGSYDVSDPSNIVELDQFRPYETLGDGVIPHNVHVWDDWLIISYYTDGCIIVDGSRPENLVEVANFDTFIPASTGFSGAWGAYPFLPSGLVLVSDIGNGMYVLEPNYVRACWLEGVVTDASTSDPILGATIQIETTNVNESSDLTGLYKTGYAVAGNYNVTVSKPGYEAFSASVDLENDMVTILDAALTPLTPFAVTGNVVEAGTGNPIEDALVNISNNDFNYDVQTDADGNFTLPAFFEGTYNAYAGKWGYSTNGLVDLDFDEANNTVTIEIETGYQDPFQLDLGWNVGPTDATSGEWERDTPLGVFIPQAGYFVTPQTDSDDDFGDKAYVTSNGPDFFENSLFAGSTTITSPPFDVSTYNEPLLSFYTFIWSVDFGGDDPVAGAGKMEVNLINDFETVNIQTYEYEDLFITPDWVYSEFTILDHLGTGTDSLSNVTIEFTASSDGFTQISEAALDDFVVWDANPTGAEELLQTNRFDATPNITDQEFVINYELDNFQNTHLAVFNELGQQVHHIELTDAVGNVRLGKDLIPGIYFARLLQDDVPSLTIRLVKL